MAFDVAIVGTGPDPTERDRDGFAMAYRHAAAYQAREDCRLHACVDIERAHAEAFAQHHDIDAERVYESHREMVTDADPDIVSVCVPPAVHAEIVTECAELGNPVLIHCEKPMATQWEDCRRMVATCERENVQLTIDHQRRFAKPVLRAKKLVDDGTIGEIRRVEFSEVNLFDAGSHQFDLCDMFVDGESPAWVLAGVDTSEEQRWFGALNSNRAIVQWEYENGVQGLASTTDGGEPVVDAYLRIVGTDGEIEIQPDTGPPLRYRTGGAWQTVATDGESLYGPQGSKLKGAKAAIEGLVPGRQPSGPERPNYRRAIDHVVESVANGKAPRISGATALRGTELIYGAWESARRRECVTFPLEGDIGNPLERLTTDEPEGAIPL